MQFSTILTLIASAALFTTSNAAPLKTRSSGQATYYEVGLGSCGKTNTNTQMVAALSSSIMKKSYCGKSITLKGGKGSVTVQVVDTCPGCGSGDVDLSPSAFKKLASLDDGVVDISWSI